MARLTPFGMFLKWVLAPLALAAIGYFIVGPRLGKGVLERVQGFEGVRTLMGGPEDGKSGGPDVDVSVSSVDDKS